MLPDPGECRSEYVEIRGVRYRLRHWGNAEAPVLFLLHGWADVSANFQFLAENLAHRWHLIAPDWRGCGASQWLGQSYALSDLVCDLEGLLAHCVGTQPARVAGHSMGANVASLLAGARPQSISALALLDAYGTPYETADTLFGRIAEAVERGRTGTQVWGYDSLETMVDRLMRANPRLGVRRALFMARELGEMLDDGRMRMRIDPAWRDTLTQLMVTPGIYQAAWRRIEAPVLLVGATESYVLKRVRASAPEDFDARLACLKTLRHITLEAAGHNVHHDQPEAVAALLDDFFGAAVSQADAPRMAM